MPRLLTLRVAALERIAHELRFAPAAAARRHTARAEKLAALVDPKTVYPEDFVVFQITGFRPDIKDPELIPGDALHRDLAALLDRLSRRAGFKRDELAAPQWLTTDDLLKRWGVSRKTVERLRTRGLIGRRVALERGRAMNVFSVSIVRAVEKREGIVTTSTPRRRRTAKAVNPVKEVAGVVTPRQRRLVERAMRAGVKSRLVADRLGKSRATVFRSRARQMAERCRSVRLAIPAAAAEVIERDNAGERFLTEPAARTGLGAPGASSIAEHVADAVRAGWPDPHVERARAFAYWTLVTRAQTAARALDRTRPAALSVDRIVTDLRWAAGLKVELMRCEQLLFLRTVEVQTGTPLVELPAEQARALLVRGLATLSAAVDRFDPTVGRVAGVASMELSRAVTRWQSEGPGSRNGRGAAHDDWTRSVSPWQAWTNPPGALRGAVEALPGHQRLLLVQRYGWDGGPPRSIAELAAASGDEARIVSRVLNGLERRLTTPARKRRRSRKKGSA